MKKITIVAKLLNENHIVLKKADNILSKYTDNRQYRQYISYMVAD